MPLKALITAGPTRERIDPVRFISNDSSGKQGYHIAEALIEAGVEVTLISGPTALSPPAQAKTHFVESAEEMWHAVEAALPVDIAICTAAVCDWKLPEQFSEKLKKGKESRLTLQLEPTKDILASLAAHSQRPRLLIGFAAETQKLEKYAIEKKNKKQCDWMLANHVGQGSNVFGGDDNSIFFISNNEQTHWPKMSKKNVAKQLTKKITERF